jgi:hypothetical protein
MGPLILQQGQRTGRKKKMEKNPAREREKKEEEEGRTNPVRAKNPK